jgi:3-phenylpropionate/trans-cinnamate dioxygenase ferredoxin reductase subunit
MAAGVAGGVAPARRVWSGPGGRRRATGGGMTDFTNPRVVIVGGGQAAAQAAASLRQLGHAGPLTIVGEEPAPPYQRPPLSKAYLKGELERERLFIRPQSFYAEQAIELICGEAVAALDPRRDRVTLASGRELAFDALILATGARPRALPAPGSTLAGVHELRTLADVDALRDELQPGRRLCVVGAGYIGLEAAAAARALGVGVTVLEAAPRVLSRVAGSDVSAFYQREHAAAGVDLRVGARLECFEGEGRVRAVRLAEGQRIDCDVALVGVGVLPNQELAAAGGVVCGDGVIVDARMRTSRPRVWAAGDLVRRPLALYGREARLESVHNAIEGGKIAAADILGLAPPADDVPWFWSDQYDLKLQTAGLSAGADLAVVRGEPDARRFAVFYFRKGRLIAVDAINAPADYLAGKKLVATLARVAPAALADTSSSLKELAARDWP